MVVQRCSYKASLYSMPVDGCCLSDFKGFILKLFIQQAELLLYTVTHYSSVRTETT